MIHEEVNEIVMHSTSVPTFTSIDPKTGEIRIEIDRQKHRANMDEYIRKSLRRLSESSKRKKENEELLLLI